MTGYAFDSGVSYIQTKGLDVKGKTLVSINKIVLSGNDYELTPIANFTYGQPKQNGVYHSRFHIVGGYLFTNDLDSLLIFTLIFE